MAWTKDHDRASYDEAAQLQSELGYAWLVMWGPGSRVFWAFRCGASYKLALADPTAAGLLHKVHQHYIRHH